MLNLWDNPQNYKPCKKKQYEIWVCKPPKNVAIINKLEHTDAFQFAGGNSFFTQKQMRENPKIAEGVKVLVQGGLAQVVQDDQTFVMCGTQGELWCISAQELSQKYVWASDDSRIDTASFQQRARCKAYTFPNTQKRVEHWYLQWTKVRTVPDNSNAFACFVPANILGKLATPSNIFHINFSGVDHGKGDFIVAGNVGGQPNLNDRHVVNGIVFGDTYDNRGWTGCLSPYKTVQESVELPNLFKGTEGYEHNLNINAESAFRQFKEAAGILDASGSTVKEVRLVSNNPEPEARELAARLGAEDSACIRMTGSNYIFVLFPDMSVYRVEQRNSANPRGSVCQKRVLSSQADVKVLFDKLNIDSVVTTAHAQGSYQRSMRAQERAWKNQPTLV